ncbi:unnamed protein product [Cyclocybe aegerita]|uniref:RRM domain-containing protein n=1 Tax=Cyclocybe aegerita TaxID=1973307 RepID=A0A8S0VVN3_CYCAE|nr:unnamed protein product [Cyclocybe aegerita]
MFFNTLRTSARTGLRAAARTAAVPATRSIASLVSRRLALPAGLSNTTASRAFSQTAVWANFGGHDRPRNPPSDSIFIGNLPWSATKEELVELFSEFGTVANVRIQTHGDGRPKGFAHLNFQTKDSAIATVTSAHEEPIHFGGRDLVIDYAKPLGPAQSENTPNNRLYFGRFADGEGALRELLSKYRDSLVSIYFMREGTTGEQLHSGFIEFTDVDVATDVLNEFNGTAIPNGDTFFLSYARPKRDRNTTGGERRYGSGSQRFQNNRDRGSRESYTARSWEQRGGQQGGQRGGQRGGQWGRDSRDY